MNKQASRSPNVRRTPTAHGEQVHFVRPQWQQECDAHDEGRHPPFYTPADGCQSTLKPSVGNSRTIIQP